MTNCGTPIGLYGDHKCCDLTTVRGADGVWRCKAGHEWIQCPVGGDVHHAFVTGPGTGTTWYCDRHGILGRRDRNGTHDALLGGTSDTGGVS